MGHPDHHGQMCRFEPPASRLSPVVFWLQVWNSPIFQLGWSSQSPSGQPGSYHLCQVRISLDPTRFEPKISRSIPGERLELAGSAGHQTWLQISNCQVSWMALTLSRVARTVAGMSTMMVMTSSIVLSFLKRGPRPTPTTTSSPRSVAGPELWASLMTLPGTHPALSAVS